MFSICLTNGLGEDLVHSLSNLERFFVLYLYDFSIIGQRTAVVFLHALVVC